MNDTPEYIKLKQREIFNSIPEGTRLVMALQLMEDGKNLIESGVRNEFPGISDLDCKIETFRRMYRHDFTKEEFQEIFEAFRKKESADNE
jgi:hypothetical protein